MAALGRSKPPISERFAIGDGLSLFYSSAPSSTNKATPTKGNKSMAKLMERAMQSAKAIDLSTLIDVFGQGRVYPLR